MALRKSIRWRSLQHGGLEQLCIDEWNDSIKVRSAIVGQAGEMRHGVFYEVSMTPDWMFESVLLQRTDGVMSVLEPLEERRMVRLAGRGPPRPRGLYRHRFRDDALHQHAADPARAARDRREQAVPDGVHPGRHARAVRRRADLHPARASACIASRTARARTTSRLTSRSTRMGWWSTIRSCSSGRETHVSSREGGRPRPHRPEIATPGFPPSRE